MNITQENIYLSSAKDGNEIKKSFGLMSKRGKIGMRASKRC